MHFTLEIGRYLQPMEDTVLSENKKVFTSNWQKLSGYGLRISNQLGPNEGFSQGTLSHQAIELFYPGPRFKQILGKLGCVWANPT